MLTPSRCLHLGISGSYILLALCCGVQIVQHFLDSILARFIESWLRCQIIILYAVASPSVLWCLDAIHRQCLQLLLGVFWSTSVVSLKLSYNWDKLSAFSNNDLLVSLPLCSRARKWCHKSSYFCSVSNGVCCLANGITLTPAWWVQ